MIYVDMRRHVRPMQAMPPLETRPILAMHLLRYEMLLPQPLLEILSKIDLLLNVMRFKIARRRLLLPHGVMRSKVSMREDSQLIGDAQVWLQRLDPMLVMAVVEVVDSEAVEVAAVVDVATVAAKAACWVRTFLDLD